MPNYGITTEDTVDQAIRPMLAASMYVRENTAVMTQPGVVRRVTLKNGDGESYREPKYDALGDAQALTSGVDMQIAQQITDTLLTVTPSEVGTQVIIPKRVFRIVRDNMWTVIGKLCGDSMVRKRDKDGLTQFSSFATDLGAAARALTYNYIMAGQSAIQGDTEPGPNPIHLVHHSHAYFLLWKNLAGLTGMSGTAMTSGSTNNIAPIPAGVSQDVILNGFVGKTIAGVNLWQDNNITKDASDDAIGGIFSREALLHVQAMTPTIEKEYDASLRAWEINYVDEYAWGEYRDAWGRIMTFDAVTPTS